MWINSFPSCWKEWRKSGRYQLPKKWRREVGWHVLVITPRKLEAALKFFKDDSWPSFKCRRIDDLRLFLEKIAEAMKAVSYIMEDDTMLQISGVPPEKVFVLTCPFYQTTFFRPKTVLSWTSANSRLWVKSVQVRRLGCLSGLLSGQRGSLRNASGR
jgi:hypothetical protein